jgi:hypothetical protein
MLVVQYESQLSAVPMSHAPHARAAPPRAAPRRRCMLIARMHAKENQGGHAPRCAVLSEGCGAEPLTARFGAVQ